MQNDFMQTMKTLVLLRGRASCFKCPLVAHIRSYVCVSFDRKRSSPSYYPSAISLYLTETIVPNDQHAAFVQCASQIIICVDFGVLTLLLLKTSCSVLANSVDQDQLASEEAN